jgi:hypothetical protein
METIQPGNIIFFTDEATEATSDSKARYNQIGIFMTEENILFRRKRKIISISADQLKGTEVKIFAPAQKEVMPQMVEFFKAAKDNYRLFNLGLNVLASERIDFFYTGKNIMPTFNTYLTDEEYEKVWERVISKLRKSDLIFTFNSKSLISRIIAWVDKGSWSHCGIYAGNHEIFEMTSKGTVTSNIDIYKAKYMHLGIYRRPDFPEEKREFIDEFRQVNVYNGYPYFKALILGIRTLLDFTDGKHSPLDLTPNGIIYEGAHDLVDYV